MENTQDVEFDFERATKNTYRFKERAPEGEERIGTLYVKKGVFTGEGAPSRLSVVVRW